jgi:hypothetical protein
MAYWIITVISEFVKKFFHSFVLFDLTLSENDIFTLSSKLKKNWFKGGRVANCSTGITQCYWATLHITRPPGKQFPSRPDKLENNR